MTEVLNPMCSPMFHIQAGHDEVELVWVTPEAERIICEAARVSAPDGVEKSQSTENNIRLIRYLVKHKHWSPFEMACMQLRIRTTREVSHQIIRHWTLRPQEFSQRYSKIPPVFVVSLPRLQDEKNRQASIPTKDPELIDFWLNAQVDVAKFAYERYLEAIDRGIAREVARKILPEGMVSTSMYVTGNLRSWIHYIQTRSEGSQSEHLWIVAKVANIFREQFPIIYDAVFAENEEK